MPSLSTRALAARLLTCLGAALAANACASSDTPAETSAAAPATQLPALPAIAPCATPWPEEACCPLVECYTPPDGTACATVPLPNMCTGYGLGVRECGGGVEGPFAGTTGLAAKPLACDFSPTSTSDLQGSCCYVFHIFWINGRALAINDVQRIATTTYRADWL